MSGNLNVNTKVLENKVYIELSGSIDEDADFKSILDLKGMDIYEFDFQKIDLINSCGVREWTNFINDLSKDSKIKYFNCRQIVIEQINMVHGFIPENATIETFFAPYFCEYHDKEFKILLKTVDISNKAAPEVDCPEGGHKLEFDAIEKQYFNFIK